MQKLRFFVYLIVILSCNTYAKNIKDGSIEISSMSFNLRVPVDPPPLDWSTRRHLVMKYINSKSPDFLGVQEAVPDVVKDLAQGLPGYAFIGRGRDKDGAGEGSQIFYKSDLWAIDKDDNGTLQFSPSPDVVGSNGWNLQYPRIFTWARFINKKTGDAIYVFNTHFPLVPEERLKSSHLLAEKIASRKHYQDPLILIGDFNACESEESIQYLLGANESPVRLIESHRALHADDSTGTFHAFGKQKESCKIDFIFTSAGLRPATSEIIKDDPQVGYASDHYAIVAKVKLVQKR